ncbi:hypothetical protein E4L95_10265 [Paracoccus liaowanqingii]|uniref:Sulfotransferase family protein n=1 Tax=Paracoccus liaowanqingii TaxID=2560053 RepID=A0A4Z1CCA1_9RHOB|nr:hypothetical protein [Paracoccus liaowanqingii]TGN60973.1 hypothetical protein E4L95_10265 [Paracoccus liaowanqingii]
MQTLWLHIGMQKTGTSAVQTWMARNEARLFDAGLLYVRPRKGLPASGALAAALNRDPPEAQRLIAELLDRVRKAGPALTDILVSSEDFSVSPPQVAAPLLDAFAGCRIRILVWLRRQDLFAEALTKQWIKWNGNQAQDPALLMRKVVAPLLDYDRMLQAWSDAFPQAVILPQIYAEDLPGQPPPDSIAALLRAMGRDPLIPSDSPGHRANVSPQAALLQHYRTLDDPVRVRQANRRLMAQGPDRFAGRGDLFSPADRQRILDNHAASNARLRARWFPDRALLFDPRDPAPHPGHASGEAAVAAFRAIYDAE